MVAKLLSKLRQSDRPTETETKKKPKLNLRNMHTKKEISNSIHFTRASEN